MKDYSLFLRRVLFLFIISVQLICLFTLSVLGPKLVYDEIPYQKTVPLVWKYGLSKEFFLQLLGAGPLYSWIHAFFAPLTHLALPQIRILNFCFLPILILGIFWSLSILRLSNSLCSALLIMALPPIYVITGMALTDLPPLAFFSIAIASILAALKNDNLHSWAYCVLSGICFGVAILGRQTYSVPLVMLVLFIILDFRLWGKILLTLFLGILPLFWLIRNWGNLVPPEISTSIIGFAPQHLINAFLYTGFFIAILCPRWFAINWKIICFSTIIGIFINALYPIVNITPLRTLAESVLTPFLLSLYTKTVSHLSLGLVFIVFFSFVKRGWEHRTDKIYLYFVFATASLIFTNLKITHVFSSRYVISEAPLLILLVSPYIKFSKGLVIRLLFGGALGFLSLSTYLFK